MLPYFYSPPLFFSDPKPSLSTIKAYNVNTFFILQFHMNEQPYDRKYDILIYIVDYTNYVQHSSVVEISII